MNIRRNQKGFTIVELLIVVVVIAILAAISIVAYTGITNRANRSAALEAANSVKSVATAFQGSQGRYPSTKAEFVNGVISGSTEPALAKLPSDITFQTGALTSTVTPKTLRVMTYGTSPNFVGFKIYYWDFAGSAQFMDVGDTTGTISTNGLAN